MCNAFNHSEHCRCGWGGEGYSGKVVQFFVGGIEPYHLLPKILTGKNGAYCWSSNEEQFSYPTKCPLCNQSVYFVRHNGGSVWFDSLGKPWDKHACFDKTPDRKESQQEFSPTDITYQFSINTTYHVHNKLNEYINENGYVLGIISKAQYQHHNRSEITFIITTDEIFVFDIQTDSTLDHIVGALAIYNFEIGKFFILLHDYDLLLHWKEILVIKNYTNDNACKYSKYNYVRHPRFGICKIIEVETSQRGYKLTLECYENRITESFIRVKHIEVDTSYVDIDVCKPDENWLKNSKKPKVLF